jgi:hypothetical protein
MTSSTAGSPRVLVRFFSPSELAVFNKCLAEIPDAGDVIVQPLWRIGKSGARVFVFYPNGIHSFPHVGKIHTTKGIDREAEGLRRAYNFFRDALPQKFVVKNDPLAMLATQLITDGGTPDAKVTELKDLLFSHGDRPPEEPKGWQQTEAKLLGIFDVLYSKTCELPIKNIGLEDRILGDEYAWYLRSDRTRPLLHTWLGSSADQETISVYRRQVPNPIKIIDDLLRSKRKLPVSVVHGDLHPSNVVIDSQGDPHLIDFSWCAKGSHILKDFLVMECSIRFLMLPKHLGAEAQMHIDLFLIDPADAQITALVARLTALHVDHNTIHHVLRCAKIVIKLREHAAKACGPAFNLRDYLACQAIVLYGLMCLSDYPFGTCAKALGLIGEHLKATA